jgi:hypothetical protein
VDKVGVRIVAHATATQGESGLAKHKGGDARHAQVQGFGLNVKAVLGDAGGVSAERFVGRGRTVAADDVDLAAGMPDREQ